MKILIADKFQPSHVARLQSQGHQVDLQPELGAGDLPQAIVGHDLLIVRSTKVSAETIEASDRLQMIVRAGAGTNTIDKAAAAHRGIYVCNTPGKNALAVAELTFGLLLAIDRKIADGVIDLREGRWNKKKYAKAQGLFGQKLGIVGLGDIGIALAERASAFGLQLYSIARDRRRPAIARRASELGVRMVPDLLALAASCDIVSFHVPAHPSTKGMINREFLAALRDGATVLNTSRGEIVDDAALVEAMNERGIRAGLDVYNDEPGAGMADFRSPLAQHPNVVGTHHIGASTEQAQDAIASEVVAIVRGFESGKVRHCVNMEQAARGSSSICVRHYSKVGVLASVFDTIKKAGINVEQMNNQIFAGGSAATATLNLSGEMPAQALAALEQLPNVIAVSSRCTESN